MRKALPTSLHPSRVIIACILDRSGVLKNLKVLESGPPEATSKILVALQSWKFRPAFRGNEPVEVNAILGFGVDTR
jgi:outer membrane biosynthesis protein TonB